MKHAKQKMTYDAALLKSGPGALLPLSSLPPAAKLASAFVFAVAVSLLSQKSTALASCCFPLMLAITGKIQFKTLARRLLPINFFFIFLWIFLPLSFRSGSLSLSSSGLELAALVTVKGNAVAAGLLLLLGTSTVSAVCRGLLRLRLPEKLVTLLLLTYSSLFQMLEEYGKISSAAKLRGYTPGKRLLNYKTTAYLVAMLLVRSWQRSQRVSMTMRLRGFSGRFPLLELPPSEPYCGYGLPFFLCVFLLSFALLLSDLLL